MTDRNGFGGLSQRRDEGVDRTPSGFTAGEALQQEALTNLPNDLARLLYLASLFDRASGEYVDHSRSPRFGVEAVRKAALTAHQRLFASLTNTSLKDLAEQFAKWATKEPEGFAAVAQEWRANQTYRFLAPPTAFASDAAIFENNVKLALEIIAEGQLRGGGKR
jgi:hypothetical protein